MGVCIKGFAKVKAYSIHCHSFVPSSSLLIVGSNSYYFEMVTIQSHVKISLTSLYSPLYSLFVSCPAMCG